MFFQINKYYLLFVKNRKYNAYLRKMKKCVIGYGIKSFLDIEYICIYNI